MKSRSRVILENAYWKGDEIYAKVDGVPYLVDTGAEVSMTRKDLKTAGHLKVQFANGKIDEMPYGIWEGVVWVKGPYNLLTVKDLGGLGKRKNNRRSLERRLTSLKARLLRVGPTPAGPSIQNWYKPVDIPAVKEQKIEESDFSPAGKGKLREIIASAKVARFKNDCGDLGPRFVHHIEGGVHPPVRQYPLNPGAVEEMDKIVKELSALGIIREEPSPITNSPIQAVKKPESAGGGWRPVINFKALNRRTIANRASLINPQGTLKTLQVKKFKSCIDLANGFFSLRLAKQSQDVSLFYILPGVVALLMILTFVLWLVLKCKSRIKQVDGVNSNVLSSADSNVEMRTNDIYELQEDAVYMNSTTPNMLSHANDIYNSNL